MPIPLMAIGAGIGALGSIGKMIFGGKQRREARKINPIWQQYQTNPFAKQQLGLAQQMFGGRMAGAAEQERNILSNQANFNANIGRNATDSSQLLALAAAGQGQTNNAFQNLQIQEAQNKYGMLNNLNNAYGQMIQEGDKAHQSQLQKYQMDMAQKQALLGGGAENIMGGLGDLASLGIISGKLFGKK